MLGHRPMYLVLEAGGTIDPHFQEFEQLLVDYKVSQALLMIPLRRVTGDELG